MIEGLLHKNTTVSDLIWSRQFDLLILKGDCRLWLDKIPAESIHLTVTDPPYESLERHRSKGTTTRLKESAASSNKWFSTFPNRDFYLFFQTLYNKHAQNSHCYIFCDSETEHVILSGRNPYDVKSDMELMELGMASKHTLAKLAQPAACGWKAWPPLTWVKTTKVSRVVNPINLRDKDIRTGMGYHWRRCDERILFLEKGKRKLNDLSMKNILVGPRAEKKDYPTAKPLQVIERLVHNSGEEGEILLDPFAGSGVAALAALDVGMKPILIDVDISWIKEHVIPVFNDSRVYIFEIECRK